MSKPGRVSGPGKGSMLLTPIDEKGAADTKLG